MAGQRFWGPIPQGKYEATTDPGVTDDDTAGFCVGSEWANKTSNKVWFCTDNTSGAAVWVEAGGSGPVIPTPGCIWPVLVADAGGNLVWGLLTFDSSGNIVVDGAGYPVLGAC